MAQDRSQNGEQQYKQVIKQIRENKQLYS
jgi:serine/threonine protein kinase